MSWFSKTRGYGEGVRFKPRFGFIVPHTAKAQGAMSIYQITEYQYWLSVITNLPTLNPSMIRSRGLDYAASNLAGKGVNVSIEPHFNAFNKSAHGMEVLILKGDSLSREYAVHMVELFRDHFPDRRVRHGDGILEVSRGDRGYKNLKIAKKYMKAALLPELFFGDNEEDFMPREASSYFFTEFVTEIS